MNSFNSSFTEIAGTVSKTAVTNWLYEENYTADLIAKDIDDVLLILFKGYESMTKVVIDNKSISVKTRVTINNIFVAELTFDYPWE